MGWDPTVYNPWAIFGLVMPHDGIIVDEGYFHDCCDRTTTYYMQNGGVSDMRTLAYARQSCLFLSAFSDAIVNLLALLLLDSFSLP